MVDADAGWQQLPALRDELLAMARADQLERAGDPSLPPGTRLPPEQDHVRAVRLAAIIDAHGWPTRELVGKQASSAAWLVAQHADSDVALQRRALDLLQSFRTEHPDSRAREHLGRTSSWQSRGEAVVLWPTTPPTSAPWVSRVS